MLTGKFGAIQGLIVITIALVNVAQSCPELRQCFPEIVVTVPCQGSVTPVWTNEPSDTDCSIYVACFNGVGIIMCCPDGMYFNPDTQLCDDETNVDCQIEPPACETTTNSPDTTTTTSAEETPTQDPDISTTTDTTTTTSDTDTTTQESTTTEDTTSTAAVETTTVQEGVDLAALCAAQPTDSLVELAFPGECSMYVMCENRELVATELCPAGLHFNPILSVCDSPDHAECLEFVCQDNPVGSQVALASLNSCQRYFICIGNVTVERFCAPGTIYEAENEWCIVDDLENPCEPERLPPPPESVINQCTEENELNKIAHPSMCDVYYRCLNGRLWVRQCPPGLFFDPERGQCNLPEFVSCDAPV